MTREEMIAAGLVPEETKHNGHRRAYFHDYNRPGVYMITIVTEGRLLILSPWVLEGHSDYGRFHSLNDLAREICEATDTRLLGVKKVQKCTF